MGYRVARVFLAMILVAALVMPPPVTWACGPDFPETVFIQKKHPDEPLQKYAAGDLGILQPSYARSYLVVAYRYLNGGSFSKAEQAQLMELWAHRLDREKEWLHTNQTEAQEQWLEARTSIAKTEKVEYLGREDRAFKTTRRTVNFVSYENCAKDAFLTAARTLKARARKFGPASAQVRDWVEAQDTVFQNCGDSAGKRESPFLPVRLNDSSPALLRADRDYQIAAAYFYAGNWREAEQRFTKISEDADSPWKKIAAIVAVRCGIRSAMMADTSDVANAELVRASQKIEQLRANSEMQEFRPTLWRMRGYVEFRLHPEERARELAQVIEAGTNPENLAQDLNDYTELLDGTLGDEPGDYDEKSAATAATRAYTKAETERRGNAMTDWIITFQATSERATAHAYAQWKETHSPAWLVAAVGKEQKGSPHLAELLEAADQASDKSPAQLTLAFQRARLLMELGKQDAAREIVRKEVAAFSEQMPVSAKNTFLALQMKLARNLDEFLRAAPRFPAAIHTTRDAFDLWGEYEPAGDGFNRKTTPQKLRADQLDTDAAVVLTEKIPLHVLAEAVVSTRLPETLRVQLAQVAWTRAVLLHDETTAKQIAPTLAQLNAELAEGLRKYVASTGDESRFAAVYLILQHPELRPFLVAGAGRRESNGKLDPYRDNWWCSLGPPSEDLWNSANFPDRTNFAGPLLLLYPQKATLSPAFLSAAQYQAAEKEWRELVKLNAAPGWLGRSTIRYAKLHPNDARVAEALHRVVRATRYGCYDTDPENTSRTAFLLLHKKYPKSEWTAKTPYWF